VRRTESGAGGLTVTIKRGDVHFYLAHLDSVASNLRTGQRITAGTQVGTLGDTGGARGTAPHLHFSIYKGSYRQGVDPFPYLQRAHEREMSS
jgi:peptidoglycan LD-endopeptidase LytH